MVLEFISWKLIEAIYKCTGNVPLNVCATYSSHNLNLITMIV